MLRTEGGCLDWETKTNATNKFLPNYRLSNKSYLMAMLSKHAFPYTGVAFECSKTRRTIKTFMNFFGAVYEKVLVEHIDLSREECSLMVESKKCGDSSMTCDDAQGNECSHTSNLIEQHQWMADRVVTGYDCKISASTIVESEPLEEAKFFGCPLTDLFCKWGNKTVIWERTVYEGCPFDFDQEQLVNWTAQGNDFLLNNGHFLKVVAKLENVSSCGGAQIFKTAEGIYLASESEYNTLKNRGVRLIDEPRYASSLYKHLLLSEIDSNRVKILERAYQAKKQKCESLVSLLDTLKSRQKYFLKIFDSVSGTETVVYADRGAIWLPKCVQVDNVSMVNQISSCHEQIEVLIDVQNETFRAFLGEGGVATLSSESVPCPKNVSILLAWNGDYSIFERVGSLQTRRRIRTLKELFLIDNSLFKANFPHYAGLLKDTDMMRIFKKERNKMDVKVELIENIEVTSSFDTLNGIGDKVSEWAANGLRNMEGFFIRLFILALSICVGVLALYLVIKWKIKTLNNKSIYRKEEVELDSIRKVAEENVNIYDVLDSE